MQETGLHKTLEAPVPTLWKRVRLRESANIMHLVALISIEANSFCVHCTYDEICGLKPINEYMVAANPLSQLSQACLDLEIRESAY